MQEMSVKNEGFYNLSNADITILNSADEVAFKKGLIAAEDVKKINVKALADSGAMAVWKVRYFYCCVQGAWQGNF